MTTHSLLAPFHALVQQHQQQFMPPLEQLRTIVDTTVQQLKAQEQELVAVQEQALTDLRTQLATDARVLINSTELDTFIAQVQSSAAPYRWNRNEVPPAVNARSADWQLAQTSITVTISDYVTSVSHDDYDDERTHSGYRYAVKLKLQNQSRRIHVLTRRIYSPVEEQTYNVRDQLAYNVEGDVHNLISSLNVDDALKPQLMMELSYLVGCASQLLSLVPQTVVFQYPIAEAVV